MPWLAGCGAEAASDDAAENGGTGGSAPSGGKSSGGTSSTAGGSAGKGAGGGGGAPTSGAGGSSSSGAGVGGSGQVAGSDNSGGASSGAANAGSSGAAAGGSAGTGASGSSGTGNAAGVGGGFAGGSGGGPMFPPLDCGAEGWAVEDHGPPSNRVNYVILGDGYTAETVNTTLVEHVNTALRRRFETESGQPYLRYRNFVNICVMKAVSQNDGIGNGPTAFDGGNGGDRLARVNGQKVDAYLREQLPEEIEVDWKAVVLNQDLWENTGSALMLWSGANDEAPGAALHEGGHGFHQLADEYCGSNTGTRCGDDTEGTGSIGEEYEEVNSTGNPLTTGGKWDLWIGSEQKGMSVPDRGATGIQSTFIGSRYTDSGQYRPSANSMMNSLFTENVNTSFNSVSREQIIFTIWRAVRPIDSTEPPAGTSEAPAAVEDPATLSVYVVDPAVINVDWTVDGVVTENGGTSFDTSVLGAGTHTVVARAYDNADMDLVRLRTGVCPPDVVRQYCSAPAWKNSEQTVAWTFTKP
ncbi:MAG TPA: M64 family metallopeptidase [Polyangiaceae bacterium]